MQAIQYKGFEINYRRASPMRGGEAKYFVESDGFNSEGYATLNNAKGAITKHIKAKDGSIYTPMVEPDITTLLDDFAEVDQEYIDKVGKMMTIYLQVPQSRNKREGRYVGCTDGQHVRIRTGRYMLRVWSDALSPRTRKQRKLIEINFKNKQK